MWNDIQIQYSSVYEIAEALMNNEVDLVQLKYVPGFAAKARLVEEAVWEMCKSRNDYQRYLEIYHEGMRKLEIDELMWHAALQRNDMGGYLEYGNSYPQGIHVSEVDDMVWGVAQQIGSYDAYLNNFPNGNHADEARIRQAEKAMEEEDWKEAKNIDTPESYKGYVYSYPQGQHIAEANQRIAELLAEQKERIIQALSENRNAYSSSYIKVCGITADDLRGKIKDSKGQVRDEVLKSWNEFPKPLTMGVTPTEIPEGSTEVYFWGVPGAGRTCMLAAMLNAAQRMGVYMPREGEGLGFMTDLAAVFNTDPSAPAVPHLNALSADTLQFLPLSLLEIEDKSHYKEHKLSIVVSSAEVVVHYSRRLQGLEDSASSEVKATFEHLNSYLLNKANPKYHFFVLDCNGHKEEKHQAEYLQRVALYFQKYEIFNSTTAGIGIIVTKCDLLSPDNNEWPSLAEEYVNKFYPALLNKLKHIVGPKRYGGLGVNNGNVNIIPFSVGELFFKSLVIFNPEPAERLVKILMECTPTRKD